MTRGGLRARILELLNEDAGAPVFMDAAEVNDLIDEAAEVVCEHTEAIRRTVFVPLLPGTTYYTLAALSPTLQIPWRMWMHAEGRRLAPVTMLELDAAHETWPTVTGSPWQWFPVSWDLFGVYPRPTVGGGTLRVDVLAWPRSLDHDGDEPELLAADHDALMLYGVYAGAAKRWDALAAVQAWAAFLQRLGAARARTNTLRAGARSYQKSDVDLMAGMRDDGRV